MVLLNCGGNFSVCVLGAAVVAKGRDVRTLMDLGFKLLEVLFHLSRKYTELFTFLRNPTYLLILLFQNKTPPSHLLHIFLCR